LKGKIAVFRPRTRAL